MYQAIAIFVVAIGINDEMDMFNSLMDDVFILGGNARCLVPITPKPVGGNHGVKVPAFARKPVRALPGSAVLMKRGCYRTKFFKPVRQGFSDIWFTAANMLKRNCMKITAINGHLDHRAASDSVNW